MKKQRKFLIGGVVVAATIGYLMVTGMAESQLYFHTPSELVALVAADAEYHQVGVRVGGRVAAGTVQYDNRTLDLRFEIVDIEDGTTSFPVTYQGPLPETFEEGVDVVAEGRMGADGVFRATTVLTKCGSRYEAGAEDYLS